MADAVLSVPGLFLTCVKYFELIRLGRNFEEDYESSALLLRSADLRLRRWGEAVGITDKESPAYQAAAKGRSAEDIDYVEEALDFISARLKTARTQADSYATRRRGRSPEAGVELETIDEDTRLTADGTLQSRSILRLRKLSRKTLDFGSELQKGTRWALYKKTELANLLREVTEHVSTLEQYFPGRLDELTQADATQLAVEASKEEIETILGAAMVTDPKLSGALKAEGVKMNQHYGNISLKNHAVARMGDIFAVEPQSGTYSYTWDYITADGNARLRTGNDYGNIDSAVAKQAERMARQAAGGAQSTWAVRR